jgi:hypothetical protein
VHGKQRPQAGASDYLAISLTRGASLRLTCQQSCQMPIEMVASGAGSNRRPSAFQAQFSGRGLSLAVARFAT